MTPQPLRRLLRHLGGSGDPAGPGGLSDAQLLERFVHSRDEAAFEVLVWRHGGMVHALCRRLLGNEPDVEDAFQATFLTLVRRAGSISKRHALASWLYKVAYRVALAARTLRQNRARREQPWFDLPDGGSGDNPARRELGAVLDDEVSRLPEKYRSAFVLCCLEGKSGEEAADQLGCPKGTVLSRLARARERLRRRLTRRGLGLAAGLAATLGADGKLAGAAPAHLVETTLKAARSVALGQTALAVTSRVAVLTEGAIRVMFVDKLKTALLVVVALGLAGVGAGIVGTGWLGGKPGAGQVLAQEEKKVEPAKPARSPAPEEAVKWFRLRMKSQNNLKAIGIALHSYSDTHKHLPSPAIYSKEGKPLLSWRVALLPYLEQDHLYKQFKLDEPWDSAHNKALLKQMPAVYAPVGVSSPRPGLTYYLALVGKGAAFEPRRQLPFPASFTDGTSNTIMIVEAAAPVPWTKPEDLPYVQDQALPKFGGLFHGNFNALFADASVQFLSKKANPDHLRAAITRAGGEVINFDAIQARDGGFTDEEKLDAKVLPQANARLKRVIAATLAEVAKIREEVEILKLKARGLKNVDANTLKLLKENAELQKTLEKVLVELESLKEEKARLEKKPNTGSDK
jgi:RNA polymerase sigma factor (sigma-70 family)